MVFVQWVADLCCQKWVYGFLVLNAVFLLGDVWDVTVVKIVFLLIEVSIILELKANMLLRIIRDCAGYNQHVDSVWELGGQCSVLESYHW